jgi:hypothetical protein
MLQTETDWRGCWCPFPRESAVRATSFDRDFCGEHALASRLLSPLWTLQLSMPILTISHCSKAQYSSGNLAARWSGASS